MSGSKTHLSKIVHAWAVTLSCPARPVFIQLTLDQFRGLYIHVQKVSACPPGLAMLGLSNAWQADRTVQQEHNLLTSHNIYFWSLTLKFKLIDISWSWVYLQLQQSADWWSVKLCLIVNFKMMQTKYNQEVGILYHHNFTLCAALEMPACDRR